MQSRRRDSREICLNFMRGWVKFRSTTTNILMQVQMGSSSRLPLFSKNLISKTMRMTTTSMRIVSSKVLVPVHSQFPSSAVANMFSGEEVYGRYLDLHANHTAYNNLKNVGKRLGYLQYIDALLHAENGPIHGDAPKDTRFSRDYET